MYIQKEKTVSGRGSSFTNIKYSDYIQIIIPRSAITVKTFVIITLIRSLYLIFINKKSRPQVLFLFSTYTILLRPGDGQSNRPKHVAEM